MPQRGKIDVSVICVSSSAEQVTWPHPGQEWQQHPDLCLEKLSSGRNKVCAVFFTLTQSSQKCHSFLCSFQMKINMNYHIIPFLFWFLYNFICSVKVQIWCELKAYSFTLDISFLYNFISYCMGHYQLLHQPHEKYFCISYKFWLNILQLVKLMMVLLYQCICSRTSELLFAYFSL